MSERTEHLDWCKKRALGYVDAGDAVQAYSSMISDLRKHEETNDPVLIALGFQEMMLPGGPRLDRARKYIEGFN